MLLCYLDYIRLIGLGKEKTAGLPDDFVSHYCQRLRNNTY